MNSPKADIDTLLILQMARRCGLPPHELENLPATENRALAETHATIFLSRFLVRPTSPSEAPQGDAGSNPDTD